MKRKSVTVTFFDNQGNVIRKDENLLLSMRDIIAMKIKNN